MTKEVKIELTEAQRAKIAAATEKLSSEPKVTGVGKNVPESTAGRISREALRAIGEQGLRDVRAAEAGLPDAEIEDQDLRGPDIPESGMGAEISDREVRREGLREEGLREEGPREEPLRRDEDD